MILRGTSDILEVYNNTTGLGTATFGFEPCGRRTERG